MRQATVADVDIVATLVHLLLVELTPEDEIPRTVERIHTATEAVLTDKTSVWAFLAESDEGEVIGVLTLNECASIYAGGRFDGIRIWI